MCSYVRTQRAVITLEHSPEGPSSLDKEVGSSSAVPLWSLQGMQWPPQASRPAYPGHLSSGRAHTGDMECSTERVSSCVWFGIVIVIQKSASNQDIERDEGHTKLEHHMLLKIHQR